MKQEEYNNLLSPNVEFVLRLLDDMAIEIYEHYPVGPIIYRVTFQFGNIPFAIDVMGTLLDIQAYVGILTKDDFRLSAAKEGCNFTNFGLIGEKMQWTEPDKESNVFFIAQRWLPVDKATPEKLKSSLNSLTQLRETWDKNCDRFMGPDLSDLRSRSN